MSVQPRPRNGAVARAGNSRKGVANCKVKIASCKLASFPVLRWPGSFWRVTSDSE
jgi:hypothetical protein